MKLDDKVCYCYGVSLRKLINFARREKPEPASRMSECLSAGTGCGWCIPVLIRIAESPEQFVVDDACDSYAAARRDYIREGHERHRFEDPPCANPDPDPEPLDTERTTTPLKPHTSTPPDVQPTDS